MPKNLFKKGEPRPANAGRKKGSPDIRRQFKTLKEVMIEQGFNHAEALLRLANSSDERIVAQALKIMTPILEPHLKQIEHKGEIEVKHNIEFLRERMNSLVEKHKKEL